MVTTSLDKIFNPRSIAIVGASDEKGSVGYILMKNLTELGYKGSVYPVNIFKPELDTIYTQYIKVAKIVLFTNRL